MFDPEILYVVQICTAEPVDIHFFVIRTKHNKFRLVLTVAGSLGHWEELLVGCHHVVIHLG